MGGACARVSMDLQVKYPHVHLSPFLHTSRHLPAPAPMQLIIEVGLLLVKHCDRYVTSKLALTSQQQQPQQQQQQQPSSPTSRLHGIIARSPCPKVRRSLRKEGAIEGMYMH